MFIRQGLQFRIGPVLDRMWYPDIGGVDAERCCLHVGSLNEFRRGNANGGNVAGFEVL